MKHERLRIATNYATGFGASAFSSRCALIEVPPTIDRSLRLRDELLLLWRILRAAARGQALLLCSSRGYLRIEFISIIMIGLLMGRWRPPMVLYGEMYQRDEGLRGLLQHVLIRLADRWIDRYIVYSEEERVRFADTWGVNPTKMRCCGYYHKPGYDLSAARTGEVLFTGGNSFRNYEPLVEAMAEFPEQQLLIASRSFKLTQPLPANISICWPNVRAWFEHMAEARAVIVPIAEQRYRSAGLLLITEAMWFGKPLIVTDSLGVREYVEDGVTGLVVDGSPESYARALHWVLDPANAEAVATMGRRAAQSMEEQFNLANHTNRLLVALDELLAERGRRGTAGMARE